MAKTADKQKKQKGDDEDYGKYKQVKTIPLTEKSALVVGTRKFDGSPIKVDVRQFYERAGQLNPGKGLTFPVSEIPSVIKGLKKIYRKHAEEQ